MVICLAMQLQAQLEGLSCQTQPPLEDSVYVIPEVLPKYAEGDGQVMTEHLMDKLDLIGLPPLSEKSHMSFVTLTIDKEGKVMRSCIMGKAPASIREVDKRAIDAASQLSFVPGYQNGEPVFVDYTIPVLITAKAVRKQNKAAEKSK